MIWKEVDETYLHRRKEKRKKENYEKIRERCDPRRQGKKIRVLFIGESPPGATFFYCANSKLYFATKEAFEKAYNKKISNFLDCFKHLGCYLIDFFDGLANKKVDSSCQNFKNEINYITNQIKQINPEFIIVVHKRVCYCVMLALLLAGLSIENVRCLPFPRGELNKKKKHYKPNESGRSYINQLSEIIKKELIPGGILPELEHLPQPPC